MAEFTEVVRQKLRMCNDFDGCKGCQLCDSDCDIVHVAGLEDEEVAKRANLLEQIVMAWAAEHPEPVYPTWKDWMESVWLSGREGSEGLIIFMNRHHIPADIAEKLGLKPKEVEKDG